MRLSLSLRHFSTHFMKRYLRYIFLPLFVVLIIFLGTCVLSGNDMPEMPGGVPWDKIVHFGMFFVLSAVSLFDYYKLHDGEPSRIRWIFWGFVVPVIYGAAIEMMQKYFFSYRSAEWADFIADVLGSLTATVIAIIYMNKKKKSKINISL